MNLKTLRDLKKLFENRIKLCKDKIRSEKK